MGGPTDGQETRTGEVLRVLRQGDFAEEVQREIGRPIGIPEAAVLFAELCEHTERPDQARVFMACAEALENEMRSVRVQEGAPSAPHRPEQGEQRPAEHTDALQALSRLLARYGKEAWENCCWEDGISRVAVGMANRVDRLRAIGNGQVPAVAATAFRILSGILG